jgi:hypothetical protein
MVSLELLKVNSIMLDIQIIMNNRDISKAQYERRKR